MRIILRLNVRDAQDVGRIHIGPRKPGLNFLEIWDGFGGASGKVIGEAEELGRFAVSGVFVEGLLEGDDGLLVVAFLVVGNAKFVLHATQGWLAVLKDCEARNGGIKVASLQHTLDIFETEFRIVRARNR